MHNNETEKKYVNECFCCKEQKEVTPVCVTEADAVKDRTMQNIVDGYVDKRLVCKDCNHLRYTSCEKQDEKSNAKKE